MPTAKGYKAIAGFKKASTWGTPVTVGATDGIEFKSESLTPDSQFIADEQVSGNASRLFGDKGNEFHSGDLVADFKYEGLEVLLAMALGTAGVPTQQGTNDAYTHALKVANEMEGVFGTFVVYHQGFALREYTTCKVGGFSLSVASGARAEVTFPLIPQGLNIFTDGTGTVNDTSSGAAITLPTSRDFALFSQMTVDLNAYDGSAFGSGDRIYISEFSCQHNNNFSTDDVTTLFGNLIDEPVRDNFTEVTGTISFSKWQSTARTLKLLSKDRLKLRVAFTGPVADGTSYFSLTLWFPEIQFTTGDFNVGGPARVPETLNFSAARATAAPTGFPVGATGAIHVELVNQVGTDPLA